MEKLKTIIYLHGYNSSGNTGRTIQRLLGDQFNVLAPKLSVDANEAVGIARKLLAEHPDAIVLGTSLGGFVTLNVYAPVRIAINPTLRPSESLPKIGCATELAATYKFYEDEMRSLVDDKIKGTTFGFFGTKDEVINFRAEFEKMYFSGHTLSIPGGEHRIKEEELKKYVFPLVNLLSTIYADSSEE